jgi:predicted transcriptional regulator
MSAKEALKSIYDSLPDDCSFEEIEYRLYVIKSIAEGLEDAEQGRLIPQEQLEAEVFAWIRQ